MVTHIHTIQVHCYSKPDQYKFKQMSQPKAKDDEVLVRFVETLCMEGAEDAGKETLL